jgi:tetratricopeptide (TPR) repeat protein
MKKVFIGILLLVVSFAKAQDFNSFYSNAQRAFESGMYRKAYDNATKAIELNGISPEARWIRVKSSLTANAPVEYFKTAIVDLNTILNNNPNDATAFKYLALAEKELASIIFRYKTGNDYIVKSEVHYNNAISACENAIKIDPSLNEELQYRIKEIKREIVRIKES